MASIITYFDLSLNPALLDPDSEPAYTHIKPRNKQREKISGREELLRTSP